jgi:TRAP-type C4-dicarboxylate transport system substrate-binding protein
MNWKKWTKKLGVSVISVSVLLLFFSTQALAAQKQFRVVGSWSNLTMYKQLEEPFWTKELPAASEQQFTATMTDLGQIGFGGAAVLRQLGRGTFDVAHTVIDYVVSDSPELAGLDFPVLATDLDLAFEVAQAYRPIIDKYLQQNFNAKLLSIAPYPAQILFSRVQINGLEDLRGKKIRASGWTTAKFLDAAGATGVTLSFAEVPQSLQRGVVDGAVTGSLSGYSAGWGEVSNYVYPLPIGGWDHVIGVMNLDTWNSLSPSQQQLIQTLINEKLEIPGWKVTLQETREGIECLTGQKCPYGNPNKLTEIPVTKEDLAKSRDLLIRYVMPAWAGTVKPEVVQEWNETIGKTVDIQIQ